MDLTLQDRKLLAALKQDSRASITGLAQALGQSRATVQARLDRLIHSGVIQRFTIDVDAAADADMIRAVMMIELEGVLTRSVIRTLKSMPAIVSLHSTNGTWDLVVRSKRSTCRNSIGCCARSARSRVCLIARQVFC